MVNRRCTLSGITVYTGSESLYGERPDPATLTPRPDPATSGFVVPRFRPCYPKFGS